VRLLSLSQYEALQEVLTLFVAVATGELSTDELRGRILSRYRK